MSPPWATPHFIQPDGVNLAATGYRPPLRPMGVNDGVRPEARLLADRFCKATIEHWGTDEQEIKDTLRIVARQGLQWDFQAAVRSEALQQGRVVRDAGEIIDKKMASNWLMRYFQAAPRQECQDYLRLGRNTYSSSPWAYRRFGMYRSVADFIGVCKAHPIMSGSVILTTAFLGDKYPFVGAVSGVGLLAWAVIMSIVSEVKAAKHPVMNAGKAEHYKQSGENLAAIIMTAPGYHGIAEGNYAGYKVLQGKVPVGSIKSTQPKGLWGAISLDKESETYKYWAKGPRALTPQEPKTFRERLVPLLNRGLFVFGLFDNVLLPFNCLADQLDEANENK
jgi:hypothetical protein